MAFSGYPHGAFSLLFITAFFSADAAVINRKMYNTKNTNRLQPVVSGNKEPLVPMQQVADTVHFPQQPGLIGMMHEGSKMGVPMHHQVAVQHSWLFPTQQDQMIWGGTVVYVFFGIFIAYLYHQARVQNPKLFLPQQPEQGILPRTSGFSFDLFSCLSDPRICAIGFCCPSLRWADTLDKHGVMSYWPACLVMFFLFLMSLHTSGIMIIGVALLGVISRQKLRAQLEMDNKTVTTVLSDSAVWLCCQPCAIIQEAREQAVQRGDTEGV